ncbi:MAG: 3-hydroxyacyl-CoA dehydrogenase NAD-binding domain-containing protein [Bdellovibrionota bacterium]
MGHTMGHISKVGVIGSGTMGSAITQHLLMKGLEVMMVDMSESLLERGRGNIAKSFDEAVERKILSPEQKLKLESALKVTTDKQCLKDCELIIEAVFENFEVKQNLFVELEGIVSSDCVLASNTSSFSITDLAAKLKRPNRFLGVHYFYHAAKNKLVEIIPGKKTDASITEALTNFYNYYDKAPILVKDVQGFAVNRFFVPWLNEAVRLWEEGFGSKWAIDKVAEKTFKVGMGPFALMNATGVPIALHACQTLCDSFGSFYRPAHGLKKQVEEFKKDWEIFEGEKCASTNDVSEQVISDRLLAASLGVAAQLVSDGVCDITSTDLGARLGLRWPFGPFEMINKLGAKHIKEITRTLFSKYDLPVPALFDQKIELQYVVSRVLGDTAIIEFNRPEAMNALNETVVDQLERCFDSQNSKPEIKRIIFTGKGKAFVAGADIKFFVDHIEKSDLKRIYTFTEKGQELFKRIDQSKKEIYAFLDGLTLGGGLELALCADYRLGTERALMAFPETGIGIYPGLGGTQRTTRLIGKALAKYMIATGDMLNAKRALSFGLLDKVVSRPWSEQEMLQAITVLSGQRQTGKIADHAEKSFENFDGKNFDLIPADYQKKVKFKAPLALALAMQLIDQGASIELKQALQLEMDSLEWIFSTKDALEGLSCLIQKKRPQYKGA